MLIQVSAKGFELTDLLRADIEARVESSLERFRSRIGRVHVFVADVNGPKNGIDKSLRIIIDIERLPLIVVEEQGEAWQSILDIAMERAAHTVSRQIERMRSRQDRTSMAGERHAWGADENEEADWNPLRERPNRNA
jgi:ribosome-associated translation inhibitor RaiA